MNFKNIAKSVITAAVFAVALSSCSVEDKAPYPNIGENGTTDNVISDGFNASVTYCGDFYNTGFHDYVIVLRLGRVDDDNMFVNGGIELSLDVLTAQGGATYFPNGTYTLLPEDTKFNAAGIVPSIKSINEDGNVSYGYTYLYTEKDANNYWLEPLGNVRLGVSSSGSEYTIKVDFTIGHEEYSYQYEGNLAFYTMGDDNGDTTPTEDFEFIASSIEAANLGNEFENGADDYLLYLDQGDESEYVQVEFTHTAGNNPAVLPTGEWTIPSNFFEVEGVPADILLPYFCFDGYEDEAYGTTYCYGGNLVYGATSGTLKISKSGDEYNIKLKFYDSYSDDAKVTCSYTGPVSVDTGNYDGGTKAASKLSAKKSPAKKAILKTVKRINAQKCEKAGKSTRSAVRTNN